MPVENENYIYNLNLTTLSSADMVAQMDRHSSVLELRKNQFLKKINILKTFLEIETTHYLEGLDLKLSNETYAKDSNL